MPYIKDENNRRQQLREGSCARNAGELNYQLASYYKECSNKNVEPDFDVVDMFVKRFVGDKPNYQKYNDLTGCLMCCFKEIKRRFEKEFGDLLIILESYDDEIASYENLKIEENGDI